MNEKDAELLIRQLISKITQLRHRDMTEDTRAAAIAQAESEIEELKKLTGPRHIAGKARITIPTDFLFGG